MRCSCNKFPAFNIEEPEVDSLDVIGGQVTGRVRLVLTSECCGDEMKEAEFDIDVDLSDEIVDKLKEAGITEPDLEIDGIKMDVTDDGAEGFDRYESTNKKGRPIPSRYQKHFYGVSASFTVKVQYPKPDGETVDVEVSGEFRDEVQSSAMDELV